MTILISEAANALQPNTIQKLARTQAELPAGVPFMGYYVQLFPGATLPDPSAVTAQIAAMTAVPTPTDMTIMSQITALENSVTARMIQEAISGSTLVNRKTGNTSLQDIKAIRARIDQLRSQLT